jgi:hypothetical protein
VLVPRLVVAATATTPPAGDSPASRGFCAADWHIVDGDCLAVLPDADRLPAAEYRGAL